MCGVFGLVRSFSVNYPMFISMEFLDPAFGSGHYSAGFILGNLNLKNKKKDINIKFLQEWN